ncbi:MAG: glycosyltransferase family 9 protein [Candidatus Dormibacteraeota bacterium]|nr:glycosyltransferase family 9 protein [Candidatus Dormibacteraeota bacterium]
MDIAVVVGGGITETLQATPLLRSLRAGAPDARITLLCPEAASALSGGLPGVDDTVPLGALDGRLGAVGAARVWLELRRRRLGAVLLCGRSGLLRLAAFLAAVPRRAGPRGGLSALLLTDRGEASAQDNAAATWLRLAPLLGVQTQLHATRYDPGPDARSQATRMLFERCGGEGRLWIALAPASGSAEPTGDEAWEPERYALLANALAKRHGAQVILVGTVDGRTHVEETMLDLGVGVVDFSAEPDLRVTAAILARCDFLIAADGPLLHLAGAVGTRAVGLYGPTQGRVLGPYGSDQRIVQAIAQTAADEADPTVMNRIRVDDVLAALEMVI